VFEIHVSGPGLDATRRVAKGDEPIVLGRDPECDVCLPDPERTVSRKHLELWAENAELHFRVVSSVNGVEMAFGEAPPGARGVLPQGQSMKVGEDDPFSDWGFNTTHDPNSTHASNVPAAGDTGDLSSFFRGLGIDTGSMSKGELEAMGRVVRLLVLGTLDLHATVTGVKNELRSEDRTMVAPKDNNPLKTNWPAETKLRYLFGGRIAAVGYIPAERAMREVLVDLVAHNSASAAAARAAIEGTLRDLAPGAIKSKLLEGRTKLFEGTRAWDAFSKWHDEQSEHMQQWVQRQLDRHFTEAYLRESLRIRRETKK
jgi:predicted component of type VI protein secretion system